METKDVCSAGPLDLLVRLQQQWAALDPCDPYRADVAEAVEEIERLRNAQQYDMSKVIHLTHRKAQGIIKDNGYALTGFVLTDTDGRKCIVDMSAVRWFDDKHQFFRLMHTDALPPNEQGNAPRDGACLG